MSYIKQNYQILDMTVYISDNANTLGKYMNLLFSLQLEVHSKADKVP